MPMTAEANTRSAASQGAEGSNREIFLPPERKAVKDGGKPHVTAKNFSIFYGDFEAVKKVNAEVLSRYVTAIIGPSGCGKSTFLRAINRMNDLIPSCHTAGTLMFNGEDIYGKYTDEVLLRKRIGMVFQKPNPFPKSIFDNIAYGPRLHGINDRKTLEGIVEKSLKKAALWDEVSDRLDRNALGLSGGQQQRLCVARALAVEPDILLLDEPTSALDPKATAKIEDLIEELRGSYTILIVTHNMQQASRVSDYTMFFYEGVLVEYAPTKQLFTNPKDQMTEDYITGRFS
ncbi:phosphate ABC transporter ATP-binding protein [Prosthecochloris sp. N3]|uniref:Phosphate ABC transporter ATP-binding protein n=1 Tax=Prosthecochloris ethylica TaxID=2743976 RepID=A0ABR9XPQ2_9CHLB|nr:MULTISPECIES: phosphate ABC transporter ATP-binding protein PstB [Prosthecochloris]MEC9486302.1 phosphate ABC transporter ATP-binding protein PstB [Prosthecochloris sp.]MBF0586161.1 phosphate ABC transporter ATP-binding protein [Prosthecochloris ethylica]MBF0635867.1 phosphate ABC transporter ATP-binding protein [Prosthecochloris ethylica]NUK47458.1 phosphate ABC transporter ATP-binding protein [Prosthecochloris ethylica]RNA65006.1 phosphate ABC transporter ATP-binding protein [Prosthecochl